MFRWITSRKLKSAWSDIDTSPRQARDALEKIAQTNEAAVLKAEEKGKAPKSADLAATIQARQCRRVETVHRLVKESFGRLLQFFV